MMNVNDLKYSFGYTIPFCFWMSVQYHLIAYWLVPIVAFVAIPIIEYFLLSSNKNLTLEQAAEKADNPYFDILLFINVPIVIWAVYTTGDLVTHHVSSNVELLGLIFSLGITLGANGINAAHELGHRQGIIYQVAAKILLTTSLYNHFTIEHNRGHHLNVGTPADPATARKGEWLFQFWIRSSVLSYMNAWKLENKRLNKAHGLDKFLKNEMLLNSILTVLYLIIIFIFFTIQASIVLISAAVVSFLLLESINYVEHYGLLRKKNESGRYERVEAFHSWNSNHVVGRIVLYELTRHSDHHYKANKPYQLLDHHDEAPLLPYGYPTSIVIALIPPLWFSIMDKRLKYAMDN